MLLPVGYPDSVSRDYMRYQLWDTLQGFMSYMKGVLCTLAFLQGIGVGSKDGSLSSAMFVWIVRDAVGMVAGLVAGLPTLTNRFSDMRHLKLWRMWAEVARAVGGGIELASTMLPPDSFILLISFATSFNAFASVASSCTRGALVLHFSKDGKNIADCAAKEGNQDRAVKLIGIAFAVVLVRAAADNTAAAVTVYALITALHLYFNWLAMAALDISPEEVAAKSVQAKKTK